MKNLKYIKTLFLILLCSTILTTSEICLKEVVAEPLMTTNISVDVKEQNSTSLAIVASPKSYLGKTVTFNAKFDKFSTLGLDYKTAYKSSEEYISFLIKRDDTAHDIPLSELKLFLKREMAEKFVDLKLNDEIQITGNVFSDALGDAWIDVSNLVIIKKAPEKKDGV